jgi:hypothetical protein
MHFDLKKADGTVVVQRQTARACYAISACPGNFIADPPDFPEPYFMRKVNALGTTNKREEG